MLTGRQYFLIRLPLLSFEDLFELPDLFEPFDFEPLLPTLRLFFELTFEALPLFLDLTFEPFDFLELTLPFEPLELPTEGGSQTGGSGVGGQIGLGSHLGMSGRQKLTSGRQ